jgi:TolB-like protein
MMMAINGKGCRAFDRSKPWGSVDVTLVVFALVLGATSTGCSFLWVTRPTPQEKGSEYPMPLSCTSSYWTPGLDTAAVVLFGAATANLAVNPSSSSSASDRAASVSIDSVLAATALVSAIYGYHYVAKCRQEKLTMPAAETAFAPRRFYSQPPPPPPPLPSPVVATVQVRGKRLAVLEFQGRNLDQDILMTFSDTVRGGALLGLEPYGVSVMTRENMLVLLRDMGKQECGEGDCEVETARNMGADYVVSGKVVRIEQLYVVTLKLHETQGGSLLGSETVEGASQVELMRSLREHGRQLVTAAFGPGPDSVRPIR